jgi:molecular chaperone GrpE
MNDTDENTFQNGAPTGTPAAASSEGVDETAQRIAALEAEAAKLKDQALRALADAENTRRRMQREIEENNKFAVSGFARDILPVADNLRRALDSIPADSRASDERLDKFAAGVELTERELMAILERYGICRLDPVGQAFDPNLHQAMMEVDSSGSAPGTVVHVVQAGYTIHGRLLRPAMVTVAKDIGAAMPGAKIDTTA